MRIARVVEKGNSNENFPLLNDALPGVTESTSKGEEHKGSQGLLAEEAANDEDEPDD